MAIPTMSAVMRDRVKSKLRMNSVAGIFGLIGLITIILAPHAARSQTSAPQPRVIYGMHTAAIAQIRATPDFNRVVTIGQDKMVRVWRTEDLKLIRAIPLPSDEGNEGDPRSLVITGKGQEVIVGGHTGISWGKQSQLYRLDLDTGRMMETIR